MCGKDGVGVLNMWKNLGEDFFFFFTKDSKHSET